MAIVVGEDSYVTVEEATSYIQQYYTSKDERRLAWEALTEEDKEVFLRKATRQIDLLPLQGVKLDTDQKLQFPRLLAVKYLDGYFPGAYSVKIDDSPDIPDEVKRATIEQVLFSIEDAESSGVATSRAARLELQRQGVHSISIGDYSESFGGDFTGIGYAASVMTDMSSTSLALLSKWIGGGFRVWRS